LVHVLANIVFHTNTQVKKNKLSADYKTKKFWHTDWYLTHTLRTNTQVKKNKLSADYNETFEFIVDADGIAGDLMIHAYDWDRTSAPDLIGEAIVSRLAVCVCVCVFG
jgi:hypothetical protein